jgi:hypothetical protein
VSFGGVTSIATAFCFTSPLIVAYTVSVPERVNGRRQVRVGGSPLNGVKVDGVHGDGCAPDAGAHFTESTVQGTLKLPACAGETLAVTVTVSL